MIKIGQEVDCRTWNTRKWGERISFLLLKWEQKAINQKSTCMHNVEKKTFIFFSLPVCRMTRDQKFKSFVAIDHICMLIYSSLKTLLCEQMSSYMNCEYKHELHKSGSIHISTPSFAQGRKYSTSESPWIAGLRPVFVSLTRTSCVSEERHFPRKARWPGRPRSSSELWALRFSLQ